MEPRLIGDDMFDSGCGGSFQTAIGMWLSIDWPARSPNLTSCDFFLWGYIKELVYVQRPFDNLEDNNGGTERRQLQGEADLNLPCRHVQNATLHRF
jgi:hypothetical protein